MPPASPPHPVTPGALRRPSGPFRLIFLALALGAVIGLLVFGVQNLVVLMQRAVLGFAAERRVVLPDHASYLRIFLALAVSGLPLALLAPLLSRRDGPPPIDAVEANALRGGTMTWFDAVAVVLPILLSVCFGASVGIEAAVTQIGAVLASQIGRLLKRPRSDLRILVGAGAAAYRAAVAGVLDAFELVIGTYAKRTLAPVGAAALSAVPATRRPAWSWRVSRRCWRCVIRRCSAAATRRSSAPPMATSSAGRRSDCSAPSRSPRPHASERAFAAACSARR